MTFRHFLPMLALILAACTGSSEEAEIEVAPPAATQAETPSSQAVANEPVYVDVRTPEEFATGHLAGAINIPHDQMEQRWEELAAFEDREMVVYCRTGRRSGIALEVLERQGFENVENGGGFDQLVAAGVPAE